MRTILSILLIPLIFIFGKSMVFICSGLDLSNYEQVTFLISFISSFILCQIFIRQNAYIAIFEHELTHNFFAIMTLNRPVGFHVNQDGGGLFQYEGRGNVLITLGPYFFPVFTALLLPLYLIVDPSHYTIFYILFGITFGFHTSGNIKEFRVSQPDLHRYGLLFSIVFIVLMNIIIVGVTLGFVIGEWRGIGLFFRSGIRFGIDLIT